MTIIKMCQVQEKWDLEFFRAYVPALLAEVEKSESIFEQFTHCLSEFHHRVSVILMEQPPRFKVGIAEQLYGQIKNIVVETQVKNKAELLRMAGLVKGLKGTIFDLSYQFKDNESKLRGIQSRKTKIENDYLVCQKQYNEVNKAKPYQCRYYRTEPAIDLTSIAKQSQQNLLYEKLERMKIQLDELKAKEQLCCLQENNTIRMCLERLNFSISSIMTSSKIENKFETFNRQNKNNINTDKNQSSNVQNRNSAKISEFIDEDINKIIEEAEMNCEREAYGKIKPTTAQKILEGAILAVSKDEEAYSEDQRLAQENKRRVQNRNR